MFICAITFLEHNPQKVICLGVFLIFCDDFSTKSIELCQLIYGARISIIKHKLCIENASLNISLFSCSSDQIFRFLLVIFYEFSFIVNKSQIMKRFNVFCFSCLLEISKALGFIFVFLVAEIKSRKIVQSTREIFLGSFAVIA